MKTTGKKVYGKRNKKTRQAKQAVIAENTLFLLHLLKLLFGETF